MASVQWIASHHTTRIRLLILMNLRLESVSHEEGSLIELPNLPATIGRSDESDVQLDDRWLSRQHCELDVRDGEVVLRDLGSKHGTFVNETPIDAAEVQPGDEIRVGLSRFVVRFG